MSKATENIAKLAQVAVDGSNLTPVGTVGYFPASTPPAGWLDDIEAFIATQPRAAQIEWEYATEVQRSNAMIAGVQAATGMTDEQIDELFIEAAKL